MIYGQWGELIIRDLQSSDIAPIVAGEIAQGWHSTPDKYEMRLRDAAEGRSIALTAEWAGEPAGYVNLYFRAHEGPFADTGWPMIVDFGVLEAYRRRGIGSRLMDVCEALAAQRSDAVCLGVGLHNGFGSAQRMYVKRGYVPDGSGVWYRGRPCTPYDTIYTNDDDLELFLSKRLKGSGDKSHGL